MNAKHMKSLLGACIPTILMVVGAATAQSPSTCSPLPKMRTFPTSLRDAKIQQPFTRHASLANPTPSHLSIENRWSGTTVPDPLSPIPVRGSHAAPSDKTEGRQVPTDHFSRNILTAARVMVCQRIPELPLGGLVARFGKYHQWLAIEDRNGKIVYAAGMGTRRGVPGANGQSSPDLPYTKTFIVDHRKEPLKDCRFIDGADPFCVKSETPLGKAIGPWAPYRNDCNTFVHHVIGKCETKQKRGPASKR